MRIAVLTRACYPLHGHGGLERHVFDLVRHLIARDVRVTLIAPPERAGAADAAHAVRGGRATAPPSAADNETVARLLYDDPRCTRRTVPYRTFPFAGRRGTTVIDRSTAYPLFGRRAGRVAARLVRAGEIDVVYALGASGFGYAQARRAGAPAPLILNPQGLEEFGATGPAGGGGWLKHAGYAPLRAAVRACARAADRVIATDDVLAPVVIRHLGVSPSVVRVVPNAIDVDSCDRLARPDDGRRMRKERGIDDDEAVLLSVGRLEANKGFHVLVKALAGLQNHHRRWRWVLVGDGPFRTAIQHALDEAALRDRVVLAGRTSEVDLHGWYEAATLFVHPTLYEGSSLVTLEAMAHRRAVVATRAGGVPDKVRPGVSGWLVPASDVPALRLAIAEALEDDDRLAAMGREGRAIAVARFSWPQVVVQFLDVCEEVLSPPAPRRARVGL